MTEGSVELEIQGVCFFFLDTPWRTMLALGLQKLKEVAKKFISKKEKAENREISHR